MVPINAVVQVGLRHVMSPAEADKVHRDDAPPRGRRRRAAVEPQFPRVHRDDQERLPLRGRQGDARHASPQFDKLTPSFASGASSTRPKSCSIKSSRWLKKVHRGRDGRERGQTSSRPERARIRFDRDRSLTAWSRPSLAAGEHRGKAQSVLIACATFIRSARSAVPSSALTIRDAANFRRAVAGLRPLTRAPATSAGHPHIGLGHAARSVTSQRVLRGGRPKNHFDVIGTSPKWTPNALHSLRRSATITFAGRVASRRNATRHPHPDLTAYGHAGSEGRGSAKTRRRAAIVLHSLTLRCSVLS